MSKQTFKKSYAIFKSIHLILSPAVQLAGFEIVKNVIERIEILKNVLTSSIEEHWIFGEVQKIFI